MMVRGLIPNLPERNLPVFGNKSLFTPIRSGLTELEVLRCLKRIKRNVTRTIHQPGRQLGSVACRRGFGCHVAKFWQVPALLMKEGICH